MLDRRALLISSAAAAVAGCAGPGAWRSAAPAPAASGPTAARLNTLLETFAQETLAESPETRTSLGLDKGEFAAAKARLDDRSDEATSRYIARLENQGQRLRAMPRTELTGSDAGNYDGHRLQPGEPARLAPSAARTMRPLSSRGPTSPFPTSWDTSTALRPPRRRGLSLRLSGFAPRHRPGDERLNLSARAGTIAPDFIIDKTVQQLRALRSTPGRPDRDVTSIGPPHRAKGHLRRLAARR
jgi:uncharacterized protein (DUF885 family)